jgi:subtilisin
VPAHGNSVAAHERQDPFALDGNPRPPVEFGAPGIDVEVAWSGGGTTVTTGNSFAAPHVAGWSRGSCPSTRT